MMSPILSTIDRAGYDVINILGGAVFDVCVRYLHENPWRRVQTLCERAVDDDRRLIRGQSLYTFELFPDDIVDAERAGAGAERPEERHRLRRDQRHAQRRDPDHVREGSRDARDRVAVYTVSPVHTDAYYAERIKELLALGADRVGIKDPTGLLKPERARRRCSGRDAGGGHDRSRAAFALPVEPRARGLQPRRSRPASTTCTPR